jgi:alpha-beta hydrolase superfamily lysophospholipase
VIRAACSDSLVSGRVNESTTETGVTSDGLEQLRRRWVPSQAPRGALLLVHGIGEHSGRYEHVGAAFAEAGIDVLAFDQRGFGRSGGRRAYVNSFDDYLADVEALLAERRAAGVPVILLGHSLGGLVATSYLVSDRPQPDFAVLSSPALSAEMPRWQQVLAPVLGTVIPRLKVSADFDGSILTRDPAEQTAYEEDPLRVAASTARLGREVLRAMKTVGTSLDRLRLPTYVLHGGDDTLVPPSASEPLASLPNVTRRVWDGLRHECLNEPERAEVLSEIIAWITSQLASPPV